MILLAGRDDKINFSFCVHDLLHVCNKSSGVGSIILSYYKLERKCKRHTLLEKRPGSSLQLTAVISKGAHIKFPISNSLDNWDHTLISGVKGRIQRRRRWYVSRILYLNTNRIVLLSGIFINLDCAA